MEKKEPKDTAKKGSSLLERYGGLQLHRESLYAELQAVDREMGEIKTKLIKQLGKEKKQ